MSTLHIFFGITFEGFLGFQLQCISRTDDQIASSSVSVSQGANMISQLSYRTIKSYCVPA